MQNRPRQVFRTSDRQQVAIAGFDVEGQATYRYLKTRGEVDLTILDEREVKVPEGVAAKLGPEVFNQRLEFDQIWRTPGLAPRKLNTEAEITSGTKEFFARCPAPIIGVTGSKGKGTTASLIHSIFTQAGRRSHLVGNIGQPALDVLPTIKAEDVVVYELSSFQLWDLERSPGVAVVLMVEPEHLDVHSDLDDYVKAKQNIARWQSPDDLVIHHPTNQLSLRVAKVGLGRKAAFLTADAAYIENDKLLINEQFICTTDEFGLLGPHNHENIAAAVSAAWQFVDDVKATVQAVKTFKGLEHRLQIIAETGGVTYIDDSIATTPSASQAAIAAFDRPKLVILGGSDKGSSYDELAATIAGDSTVKQVLLMGDTADQLAQSLDRAGFNNYEKISGDMDSIVNRASTLAAAGDVVLLSPACASFDRYRNYQDRAEQFIDAVKRLG